MEPPSHRATRSGRYPWRKPLRAPRSQSHNLPGGSFEQILTHAHIGVVQLDAVLRVVWVNPAFMRLLPAGPPHPVSQVFSDLFPDPPIQTALRQALHTGEVQMLHGRPLPPALNALAQTFWDVVIQPAPGGLLLLVSDATARERAIQEFHQVQTLFVHLFENAPDANLLVSQDGRIMAANSQAEAMFGYPRDEMIGRSVELLIPEHYRQNHANLHAAFWERMRKRPMGSISELYARRKDGSIFPVDIQLSPLSSERGPLALCVVHDISQHKASQMALQSKTNLVQLLQEVTSAANQGASAQAAFQTAIDRLCSFLGWPVGHACLIDSAGSGIRASIWNSQFPDGMHSFRQASEDLAGGLAVGLIGQVIASARPIWLTGLDETPDFARKEAARRAHLQTAFGVPVMAGSSVVAVLEFFTREALPPDPELLGVMPHIGIQLGRAIERQRHEEALNKRAAQLRSVVRNLPVILVGLDALGRITLMDGRGLSSVNRRPGELVGQSLLDLLAGAPELRDSVERALNSQEIHLEAALADTIYEIFMSPYFDANHNLEGVIILALDVSQRKQMESDLEETRHLLMASVETERSRLARQLHDGPLQDLYGVFYQVQEIRDHLTADEADIFETALETIRGISSTLRFICGELHPTTLAHLGLKKAIRSHSERLKERAAVSIHLDLEDDAQWLAADQRLALYRIYQALIDNVIRHANAQHVWVRLHRTARDIEMEVEDNGQGFAMPPGWVQLVRAGRFGLSGAQERAEALGGRLEILSKTGSGTLARAVIPKYRV